MIKGTNYASHFFSNIENDVDTLEKNVKEFPFSSLARFLLLYYYKKNNKSAFENLVKQTGIYINNPFWIQYQLSKIDDESFSMEDSLRFKKINENTSENISLPADEQIMQIPVSENEVAIESEMKNNSFEEERQIENPEENIPATADEQIMKIPVSENEAAIESEVKNNSFEEERQIENPEENISVAANEEIMQIPVSENKVANESEVKNNSFGEERQIENLEENIPVAANEQIMQISVSENEVANEIKEDNSASKFFETEIKNSANTEEDLVPFEPLHTVDYFASQGIKISEEELESDHLGKQVKSFTAWLKSMKKLHPGQLPEQNEVIEKIIQANAEISNQNANVLTEAMAEVLIKQNKKEKAIEMYQKLSLINPSKSAYFAAKIESLKIV